MITLYYFRRYRLVVRTAGFHPVNRSSILRSATKIKCNIYYHYLWWYFFMTKFRIYKFQIKNPNIILLDEPTSVLDSISEQIVSEIFRNYFKWKIVIVIAHRLWIVKKADKIIVFKKWKIIERWNHKTLSETDWWEYKKCLIWKMGFLCFIKYFLDKKKLVSIFSEYAVYRKRKSLIFDFFPGIW